jgi:NlpC/P60 family putative phage cell wall peptidase
VITREQIVAEARAWIGTRYQHQACLKGVATDCIGLIAGVARELELPEAAAYLATPEFRHYGRLPDPKMLLRACAQFLERKETPEPGDVLLMSFTGEPSHFAIFTGDSIIHAWTQRRKVCEHTLDDTWLARIVGVYGLRGI